MGWKSSCSAATEYWALTSATAATGFAVSIIMSPAEAGIEKIVKKASLKNNPVNLIKEDIETIVINRI